MGGVAIDDNALKALSAIADKMGVTVEHLWGVLLRQAPLDGIVSLILCVTMFFALAALSVCAYRLPWRDESLKVFSWASISGGFIFALGVLLTCMPMILASFFNPEYWALMQILNAL